jgi:phosphatidylserine/phosphatidylglycerophosphate/cardiolipin synthase-like enzyme
MSPATPPVYDGCRITPLIDGAEYAAALAAALDRVGRAATPEGNAGQCILIAGWWLGLARGRFELTDGGLVESVLKVPGMRLLDAPPYCLDPWPEPESVPFEDAPDERSALLDVLLAKARAGVDVRVLGWVSTSMRWSRLARRIGAAHIVAVNALTMRSIEALRAEPGIGGRALPNLVGHTAGSTHSKVFLVCDGEDTVGFTGGLDLELSRWSRTDHRGRQSWHDVVAQVEGPAVQGIYDHFKTLWDANLARPPQTINLEGRDVLTVLPDTPALPARTLPVKAGVGPHQIQSLETLPAARYARGTWLPAGRPFPQAPDGRFTYRDALHAAITRARDYVYVEDQLHWSREIMRWLNQALRDNAELRVILLLSGLDDPNDPPLPHDAYLCQSINHNLLTGLTRAQTDRILLARRMGVTVHAKTVIVDDVWASIGSCNIGARSLYTDVEHGIGFTDPSGELIPAYRARLWDHHLATAGPEKIADLASAFQAWESAAAETSPTGNLERIRLPLPEVRYSGRMDRLYRGSHDPDSRDIWGGPIPPGAF